MISFSTVDPVSVLISIFCGSVNCIEIILVNILDSKDTLQGNKQQIIT